MKFIDYIYIVYMYMCIFLQSKVRPQTMNIKVEFFFNFFFFNSFIKCSYHVLKKKKNDHIG